MKRDLTLPQLPKTDSSGNINQQELVQFLSAIQRILDEKQREDYNESMNKMPVNSTYIQFPHMEDGVYEGFREEDEPAELFGGVWFQMFEEEGSFFKTEGHEPAQIYDNNELKDYRIDGLSKSVNQRMTGAYDSGNGNSGARAVGGSSSGAITIKRVAGTLLYNSVSWSAQYIIGFDLDSKDSPSARTTTDTAGRTEPQNRLIRIWKRES